MIVHPGWMWSSSTAAHTTALLAGLVGLIVLTALVYYIVKRRRKAAGGLRALGFTNVRSYPLAASGSISGMDVRLEHVKLMSDEDADGDSFLRPVTRIRFGGTFVSRAILRLKGWDDAERASTEGLERIQTGDSAMDRTWDLFVEDGDSLSIWKKASIRNRLKQTGANTVLDLVTSKDEVVIFLAGEDPSTAAVAAAISLAEELHEPRR